nr:hypothetical protein [Brevibacterium renqingii]
MPPSTRTLPVSSELRWLLDHWQSDGRWPVPEAPRPTSGIVLIRDGTEGLEVFITRQLDARGVEDRNRWAFPTSSLRPGDVRKLPLAGWNSARCARALSIENKSRALHHFSAAARITFAATGILLAEDVDREVVAVPQTDWRTTRSRLFSNEVSWSQVLRDRDVKLRPDLCKPWLRWINTPTQLHRFDTTFFIATVPFGQEVDFLSPNETSGGWKRPSQVLEEVGDDPNSIGASARLIVESLSEVTTVGAAMAQVRNVHPLRPEIINDDGDWKVVIQTGKDPHSKGTLRDRAIAVGETDSDQSPGFLSFGGDDDDDDTLDEETEDS